MRYFGSFPSISYSNTTVVDITRRVKIVDKSMSSPYQFYPYDITYHLRSDHVAEYYYENPQLDWLIYLSNDVIDPYYDWYVRDDQLDELIRLKYGSTELAQRKVKYYMNNWYEHAEEEISTSYYDNNLSLALKQYYDPVFSETNKIMAYRRRRVDHIMNTNMIIDFTLNNYTTGNTYTVGELVKIWQPGEWVGGGEVVFSNSTILRIQSVNGNTVANTTTGTYLVGETSGTNAAANAMNNVITNITTEENSYWSPVYIYDWERMENEKRRTIRLIDNQFVPFLTNTIREKIANT